MTLLHLRFSTNDDRSRPGAWRTRILAVLLAALMLAALTGCGAKNAPADASEAETAQAAAPEEASAPAPEPTPKAKPSLTRLENDPVLLPGADTEDPAFADCADAIAAYLDGRFGDEDAFSCAVQVDPDYVEGDDGLIDVYLWEDGLLSLAAASFTGNEESLAVWRENLDAMCALDRKLQSFLDRNGHGDSIACVNLVEQEAYEYLLAFAMDGEVCYDQVTGVNVGG